MEFNKTADRRRVAIVEDDPFWQYQLRHNLTAIDSTIDIRVLSSAEEFIDEAGTSYDLVISDQNLGFGRTGLSLWRHLQSNNPDIAFALTSGTGDMIFDELTQAGYTARPVLIEKPYRFQTFKAQVEAMFAIKNLPAEEVERDWTAIFSGMMFSSAALALAVVMMNMEAVNEREPAFVTSSKIIDQIQKNLNEHGQAYVSPETRARILEILARADQINKMK